MSTLVRDILITLVIAVVIFIGLQATIQKYVIEGPSMNPSFDSGQLLLVNKIVYKFREPARGDVIIFQPPGNGKDDYIKRIIGLPNESVEIADGIVYIRQGDEILTLDEPYVNGSAGSDYSSGIIPENQYFVLGDNRNNSSDSRNGWTLPRENIIGKAWLSIWPPGNWGLVSSYPLPAQADNNITN